MPVWKEKVRKSRTHIYQCLKRKQKQVSISHQQQSGQRTTMMHEEMAPTPYAGNPYADSAVAQPDVYYVGVQQEQQAIVYQGTGVFSNDLFSCCDEPSVCFYGFFCPGYVLYEIMQRLDVDNCLSGVCALAYCVTPMSPIIGGSVNQYDYN